MYVVQPLAFDTEGPVRTLRGNEHGDLPVDDPPPVEHPTERYAAWRSTAIFDLAPFASPPGR